MMVFDVPSAMGDGHVLGPAEALPATKVSTATAKTKRSLRVIMVLLSMWSDGSSRKSSLVSAQQRSAEEGAVFAGHGRCRRAEERRHNHDRGEGDAKVMQHHRGLLSIRVECAD
jgi:hypothetical protein